MARRPTTEEQARDLFARQIEALRRMGPAPDSQARLAAIFAKSEEACRAQEAELAVEERAAEAEARRLSIPPAR